MPHNIEDRFVRCLFIDLYQFWVRKCNLEVDIPLQNFEDYEDTLHSNILPTLMDFCFLTDNGTLERLLKSPALMFSSENFFSEFVYSVCSKLSTEKNEYAFFLMDESS
ncbi:hypothetical protein CDAR_622171 [Caerostris darwini]|uniref:Uncharacterized protein n=1 Tax=Caerostris darwini TaxID=1538125 RepID=A0AAV4QGN0_9ARAC|nr:hypothetical protein CDAR_622171 [Caerostris darwini]